MKREDDINSLLDVNHKSLRDIRRLFNESLRKKRIDSDLRVQIKNLLENAKSALDLF